MPESLSRNEEGKSLDLRVTDRLSFNTEFIYSIVWVTKC